MSGANTRISNPAPLDYVTPGFPSLYWPIDVKPGAANYLYFAEDIWRFCLYWTLIIYAGFHAATAGWAMLMQILNGKRAFKWVWAIALAYAVIAGLEALLAGTIVGLLLGAIYNAGFYRMSTWIPFTWSLINVLVLTLSSFANSGGL